MSLAVIRSVAWPASFHSSTGCNMSVIGSGNLISNVTVCLICVGSLSPASPSLLFNHSVQSVVTGYAHVFTSEEITLRQGLNG